MLIIEGLKDCIAPRKCYSCQRQGHFLCLDCSRKLIQYKEICHICKKKSKDFQIHDRCKKDVFYDALIVNYFYDQPIIKKMIHDGKFYHRKDIFKDFALSLSAKISRFGAFDGDNSIVLSIPLHFIKRWKRGYNQSEILAQGVSKECGIQYKKHIIKKIKNTGQQSHLSREERLLNLKDSFKLNKNSKDILDKKTVILVDDVVSTGSTLNEISKLLKGSGAKEIIAAVIASD